MTDSSSDDRAMFMRRAVQALRRRLGIHSRKSWAQCGEDLIMRTVCDALRIARPSYLDVGAHHPAYLSNTYLFYTQGSRGVTVEPDPALHARFRRQRPRDTNLAIGIGPERGSFELFQMEPRTLNTMSEEEAQRYVAQGHKLVARHRVPVETIDDVLGRHFPQRAPDILSVDVEGLDFEILQSLDWSRHHPKLVCVETIVFATTGDGVKRTEIDALLLEHGYSRFADTYINSIYVDTLAWRNR